MIKLRDLRLHALRGRRTRNSVRYAAYLATVARHGISFFNVLIMLAENRPWIPAAA